MTDRTNNERQARFAQKQREAGLVKICLWVPRDAVAQVRKFVAEMLRKND